jgi:hypothetical protein
MKRIAAPMVGGIFTSFLLELLVYPAIYEIWKWRSAVKRLPGAAHGVGIAAGALNFTRASEAVHVTTD